MKDMSIIHDRISSFMHLISDALDCTTCIKRYEGGLQLQDYLGTADDEVSLGGQLWHINPRIEVDSVRVQTKATICDCPQKLIRIFVPPPGTPLWLCEKYTQMREEGYSFQGAVVVLPSWEDRWLESRHCWDAIQAIRALRMGAGVDPELPPEWLSQMEWMVKHSPDITAVRLAMVIFKEGVGKQGRAPSSE